jgi:acetylglutamate kinase
VAGLYRDFSDPTSLISQIDASELSQMLEQGLLAEGMVPKIRSCVAALANGVGRAHLLDGRIPHALLLECFTREGVGTMVVP